MSAAALRALLLFHERDLAEMKPADVIAPFLSSIEFVSTRYTFASWCIIIVEIIFSPQCRLYFPLLAICFRDVLDVSALYFCSIRSLTISHDSINLCF